MASTRKSKKKHHANVSAAHAFDDAITIPTRWLKNIIAIFLVPIAVVLSEALFTSFRHAALRYEFWRTEEFWFFGLGAVLWTIAFAGSMWVFGEPRPLRLYVLGHELTHAIWVKALGGKIHGFKVGREGGHVIASKSNFWIALTPYFHPLYSMLVVLAYGTINLFYTIDGWTPVLFGLLGLTWAFHFSFTLWMIPKGQSDLSSQGVFFSLVLIYLMNLLTLVALLIFAAPQVTFRAFGDDAVGHAADLAAWMVKMFEIGLGRLLG